MYSKAIQVLFLTAGIAWVEPTHAATPFVVHLPRMYNADVVLGTIATSNEICKLLNHPLFGHGPNWSGYRYLINDTFNWDPKNQSLGWLQSFGQRFRLNNDELNMWLTPSAVIAKQAGAEFFACFSKLSAADPNRAIVLARYFFTHTKPIKAVAEIECLQGNDNRIPCIEFGRNILFSDRDRLKLLIVLREAHPVLVSMFDSANKDAIERANNIQNNIRLAEDSKRRDEEEQRKRSEAAAEPKYKLRSLYESYLTVKACFESRKDYITGYVNPSQMEEVRKAAKIKEQTIKKSAPGIDADEIWESASKGSQQTMSSLLTTSDRMPEELKMICGLNLIHMLSEGDGYPEKMVPVKKDF